MLTRTFKADKLSVNIYDTRRSMGAAAASDIASCIKELLSQKDSIRMIFAAAPSQNEMLEALVADKEIEWNRVHALHMDEYVNLPSEAPQGFGNFLRRAIFDRVPFASVNLIGTDADSEATCRRYDALLAANTVDIVCMGIGENGHIAFNEPADHFPMGTHVVDLQESTINANARFFASADEVPRKAMTMGIGTAVMIPLGITGGCVVLTLCSRKPLYPWLISVFSLVLPLLIYVINMYPA